MAKFRIQAANGSVYEIEADDDLTEAQVQELLKEQDLDQLSSGEEPTQYSPYGAPLNRGIRNETSDQVPTGFSDTTYNTVRRGLTRLGTIPNVSMAEDFAELAKRKRYTEAKDAELEAKGEERPWWYKILNWEAENKFDLKTFSFQPKETAEDLDALAAREITTAYEKTKKAYEQFPKSEEADKQFKEILETDKWFGQDGAIMKALSNPGATAAGVLQVGGEQLPTLAAVMLMAKKNPKLAMSMMAGSSFLQERYGQLVGEAQKSGYDLSNPEDVLKAAKDEKFMKEQADKGFTRGAIIASVDLAFLGLASKAKFNLSGIGTQTVVQGVGGGTGEALAQVATGEDLQPGEILIEGLAEGVTGPIDLFTFGLKKTSELRNNVPTNNTESGSSNSETRIDVDVSLAQQLANEEANLSAAANAESEKTKDLNEKQDIEVGKKRLAAAKTFTPRDKFLKARETARKEDALNSATEIGQAYERYKLAKNVYPANKKEENAELTKFLKDFVPKDDRDVAIEEFNSALDIHAEQIIKGITVPVNNDATAVDETETDATAVNETEVDATAVNKTEVKPPKPESAKVAEARAYAEEQLGENWETVGGLSQAFVNRQGFYKKDKQGKSTFMRMVDAEVAARDESATTTEETTETKVDEATVENETTVEESANELITKDIPKVKGLSKDQKKIFDVLVDHFVGDKKFDIDEVWAGGQFQTTKIAELAGVKSKQAVSTSINRFRTKILEEQGVIKKNASASEKDAGLAKIADGLANIAKTRRDANVQANQTSDELVDTEGAVNQQVDADEVSNDETDVNNSIFQQQGINTRASVGQGNYTIDKKKLDQADIDYTKARSEEPDAYENKRQEIADKTRKALTKKRISTYGKDAIAEWRNTKSDNAVDIRDLNSKDLNEWVAVVEENRVGEISDAQMQQDQREIEKRYDADTTQTIDKVPPSRIAESSESGNTTEQVGVKDNSEAQSEDADPDSFNAVTEQAKPNVVTKTKKKINKPKFSVEETEGQATSTTANELRNAVKWFIGKDANLRATVLNNPEDLITLVLSKQLNIDGLTLGKILDKANAQGVVVTDNDGVAKAFMFADNVASGNERGVVAHEVGGHIGMDNVLSNDQLSKAATKIRKWASSETTSLEKRISERALARVGSAQNQNAVVDTDSETIAYFLEEAVNAGVTPDSDGKSDLVSFVRQLWSDFKRALRKLRPANDAALSAQDLVNMARGAARLELATTFHGSSNSFRKVNPNFIGLGNNAVGVGFYVTEDKETGATYMMQRMDERSASEGSLQRIDTTLDENDFLDWGKPLSEQPAILDRARKLPSNIIKELPIAFGDPNLALEDFTGRQFYIGLTSVQLVNSSLGTSISNKELNRAESLPTGTTTAMAVTSAYLDGAGIKGIKVEQSFSEPQASSVFNKIIFNADNAIVVGRESASDVDIITNPDDAEITVNEMQFSVPESETQNQVSWVRNNLGNGAAELLTNLTVVGKQPIEGTKNLNRWIRENKEKMPSAGKFYDFMLAAEATKNEIFGLVENVMNDARKFTMERQELINDFLGASTFYQKWGYDPQLTDEKTGKPVKVTIDPILKRKYDRLTAEEQQLVRNVFEHGRTMRSIMKEVADELGVSQFFKFDSRLQGPYAPLKRFGKYVGELKSQELLDAEANLDNTNPTSEQRKKVEALKSDANHYVISFFESLGAADTFVNANRNKFAYANAAEKSVTFEESRPGGAQAYEKIIGAVNANLAGLDQSSKDAMAKMVRDMYFQTLDDSNARLSGIKRLNRAGYDKNMLRSFAEHGMAQANLIAQMKHGGDISTALLGAYKEARKNPSELMPIYNKIALKFQRVMTPRTGLLATIETNVMKFNSFYMLTSSLGYFFQNMTQPYFAVANVAGEFGWKQAQTWGKLFSGYAVAKKVINTSFINQIKNVGTLGMLGGNSTIELDLSKAPPELQPVLKELQLRGLLDVGITEDLRHVNMSPNGFIRAYDEMTHRLYQSARYVEANNRISSAVAAFKMAQQNPQKMKRLKMTPSEFAIRIVQDTQGNFSQLDAPAAFDVLPKTPLQFRKYQFQMAWLHIDAAKQAFKGADPDMKKAGFRKLSLMLGYTGVFGGLAAVPMANIASTLLQAAIAGLSGDDEENPPRSLERWIRENVEDERTATLLTRGVPAALGWDFSQKLDQSDLFMPYNSKYVQMDPSRDGSLMFFAQLALGPSGTMVGNMGNVADFINRGNYYRAAEYMLPKGARSYLETMRFAKDGYETRSGLEITNPTQFNAIDLLTNAIGLPSTDINQIKWTRGQQIEIEQWFSKETTRIKRQYLDAHEDRDRDTKRELRQEWKELQKSKDRVRPFFNNSRHVLKRSPVSDLLRAPRNRKREQRRLNTITGN